MTLPRSSILKDSIARLPPLNKLNFQKPDKFIREIVEFLIATTNVNEKDLVKSYKTLSGIEAQTIIFSLIKLFMPNYRAMPKFQVKEIN